MVPVETIEAARTGNAKAVEDLIRICQPDVRRYAQRSCSNASDAEDAMQEATIIIYQHIGALRSVAAFSLWLRTVVRRECIRLGRLLTGRHVDIDSFKDDLRLSEIPNSELRFELAEAISSLPANYREVLILRDFEDLTMREIASRLDITIENAKVRLHRARFLVREYFLA